jgi:predicted transcriptional regulator
MEIWKTIENFEDYKVSNLGRVKSLKFNKEKLLKLNLSGRKNEQYYCVKLSNKKITKDFKVHKLVAYYFIDNNNNLIVNHIDGNSLNNNFNNLEYVTIRDNNLHKSKLKNNTPNVNFCKIRLKYRARINYNKKDIHIGYYNNKEEAYNKILEFKNLNNILSKYD